MPGLRRGLPTAASVLGVLMLSGPAVGVVAPRSQVPDAPPLVPPAQVPSIPPVPSVPAPPPVQVPEAPRLVPPAQVPSTPSAPPVPEPLPSVDSVPAVPEGQASSQDAPVSGGPAADATAGPGSPSTPGQSTPTPGTTGRAVGADALAGARGAPGLTPRREKRSSARRRAAAERELRGEVERLAGCLYATTGFETTVLVLRTGLGGGEPSSRARVARRLRTTETRVGRAERRGLRTLRNADGTDGCGGGEDGRQGSPSGGIATTMAGAFVVSAETVASSGSSGDKAPAADEKAGGARGADRAGSSAGEDKGDGAVAGDVGRSAPAPSSGESDRTPLLLLLALALLASLLVAAVRARPHLGAPKDRAGRGTRGFLALTHRRRRRRSAEHRELSCAFCHSSKVVVNPAKGVYRCAACGFSGELAGSPQAEAGKMHDVSKRS